MTTPDTDHHSDEPANREAAPAKPFNYLETEDASIALAGSRTWQIGFFLGGVFLFVLATINFFQGEYDKAAIIIAVAIATMLRGDVILLEAQVRYFAESFETCEEEPESLIPPDRRQ